MKPIQFSLFRAALAVLFSALMFSADPPAFGQSEIVLHAFGNRPDGNNPRGALVADKAGNLYGTTENGGQNNRGVVFQLMPPAKQGGAWTENVLYSFSDLGTPQTRLILDGKGVLYGTTLYGGQSKAGTVFEVAPPAGKSGAWTGTVLYSFTGGGDGGYPVGGLVLDKSGTLYGTTGVGGNFQSCPVYGCGAVFKLVPPATIGGAWTESTLYTFGGSDGSEPTGELLWDRAGNLFGSTEIGGAYSAGNAFELSPPATQGGAWTFSDLYDFTGGPDGSGPVNGLIWDPSGNLYGTAVGGGYLHACPEIGGGCGTVFKLTPPATQGGSWSESTLYSFTGGSDGFLSLSSVIRDAAGNLYGTTYVGGDPECNDSGFAGCGIVFKLAPPAVLGGPWTETKLHSFLGGTDGADPSCGLSFGKGKAVYGTTFLGGSSGEYGTVFEVVP